MKDVYLRSLHVYYNYVDRNIEIDLEPEAGKKFKHLIITGKNGSGKTTTLDALYNELITIKAGFKIWDDEKKLSQIPRVGAYFNTNNLPNKDFLVIAMPSNKKFDVELASHKKSLKLEEAYSSSSFDMISEIMMQVEAFKIKNNQTTAPSGIVLIDEIEAHLHLSLQEKILPTLVKFFPKLQFIVCTHSPQVIASIDNANIYDLTSKKLVTEFLGGISYDVISKSHFGLSSEYSLKVTKLLNKAKRLLQKPEKTEKEDAELAKINDILTELSPELTTELFLYFNMKRA